MLCIVETWFTLPVVQPYFDRELWRFSLFMMPNEHSFSFFGYFYLLCYPANDSDITLMQYQISAKKSFAF